MYSFKTIHILPFVSLNMVLSTSKPLSFQYSLYNLITFDAGRFNVMATSTVVLPSENSLCASADCSSCLCFCRLAFSSSMIACMSRGEILSICAISAYDLCWLKYRSISWYFLFLFAKLLCIDNRYLKRERFPYHLLSWYQTISLLSSTFLFILTFVKS